MTRICRYVSTAIYFLAIINCTQQHPQVEFDTAYGPFVVEVYTDKAPITSQNFLRYVHENRYKDAEFYRVVTLENQSKDSIKIEVIQGGLWEDKHPDRLQAIEHETTKQTGILHKDGTISMARWHPGTATDAFFICIGDQPELDFAGKRNPDKQGFAAFGKVISGMEVVRKIQKQKQVEQYLKPKIPFKIKELY